MDLEEVVKSLTRGRRRGTNECSLLRCAADPRNVLQGLGYGGRGATSALLGSPSVVRREAHRRYRHSTEGYPPRSMMLTEAPSL